MVLCEVWTSIRVAVLNLHTDCRHRDAGDTSTTRAASSPRHWHVSNAASPVHQTSSIVPFSKGWDKHRTADFRLPHNDDVPIALATPMYWSHPPVDRALPVPMRAHTVTLIDNVTWFVGDIIYLLLRHG